MIGAHTATNSYERWYEAELIRVYGDILLARFDNPARTKAKVLIALDVAQRPSEPAT